MPITHAKISQAVNSTDPNLIQPSDWNAAHVFTGNLLDNIAFTGNNTHAGTETFSGGLLVTGGTFSTTQQLASTVSTGTAPFSVASTTNVANLNASSLNGATFAAPGPIGSTAPSTGAFTTISASGQFTSTVSTGTAPFSVASTTLVSNLNAQFHNGLAAPASAIVGISDTQTLTSKTLTAPVLTTPTLGNVASVGGVAVVGQGVPGVVYNTVSASGTAALSAVTMATAGGSGNTYRFGVYLDQTVAGTSCTGNTTITVNTLFTDPNTSSVTTSSTQSMTVVNNGTVGTTNSLFNFSGNQWLVFRAKASTAVQYSTTYAIGANCAPGPAYQVYPILEQLV